MGFAVPSAIGARWAVRTRRCGAIDGDGCFQMTAQELVTATRSGIPVKIAILKQRLPRLVRQWQEMFYEERYSEVYLSPDLPDYVGWRSPWAAWHAGGVHPTTWPSPSNKANSVDDRPVVIDFRTDAFEKVFPMWRPGRPTTTSWSTRR